jgi:hypothetical protein
MVKISIKIDTNILVFISLPPLNRISEAALPDAELMQDSSG